MEANSAPAEARGMCGDEKSVREKYCARPNARTLSKSAMLRIVQPEAQGSASVCDSEAHNYRDISYNWFSPARCWLKLPAF